MKFLALAGVAAALPKPVTEPETHAYATLVSSSRGTWGEDGD